MSRPFGKPCAAALDGISLYRQDRRHHLCYFYGRGDPHDTPDGILPSARLGIRNSVYLIAMLLGGMAGMLVIPCRKFRFSRANLF